MPATGDAHLGAAAFDNSIVDLCLQDYRRQSQTTVAGRIMVEPGAEHRGNLVRILTTSILQ